MTRLDVIRNLMAREAFRTYLEIGVFNGHVFFRVQAGLKIAVDPEFRFSSLRRLGKTLLNPGNALQARYFQKTSDDFFAEDAPALFASRPIDLCLIDGMHELAYVRRDVENTLRYLAPHGVIILHDCNPQTPEATLPFADYMAGRTGPLWNGDVWKIIPELRSNRSDLNVFVLNTDHGLGIISHGRPEPLGHSPVRSAETLTYADLAADRQALLNLRPAGYFHDYFKPSP